MKVSSMKLIGGATITMFNNQSDFLELVSTRPEEAFRDINAGWLHPETIVKSIELDPMNIKYIQNLGLEHDFLSELQLMAVSLNNDALMLIPENEHNEKIAAEIKLDSKGLELIGNHLSKKLITQEMFELIFTNSKYSFFEDYPKHLLTSENISRVVSKHPMAYVWIPDEYIDENVAQAIFIRSPGIYPSLPEEFKTIEFLKKYARDPSHISNIPLSQASQIVELWMDDKDSVALEFEAEVSNDPKVTIRAIAKCDEAYREQSWHWKNGAKYILNCHLKRFDPASAWKAAITVNDRRIVEECFGRERLIREAKLDGATKKRWLNDSLEL